MDIGMNGSNRSLSSSTQGRRASGQQPQGKSPEQSLGTTVPEISGHHLGGEETFLSRFDTVTISYEKRSGKLVIDLPQGTSQRLAEQLESLIRDDLNCQGMLSRDSSKIKPYKSGLSQIRYPIRAPHQDQATQRVSQFLGQLIEQCEHLGITDDAGLTKFTKECPFLAGTLGRGKLDFRDGTHEFMGDWLKECVAQALNFSIIEIIDVVHDDLRYLFDDRNPRLDWIAVKTGMLKAFHLALERGEQTSLVKLAPFYCIVPSAVPEKVAEFRRKFPAHAELPFLHFEQREKLSELHEKLIRVALREGDHAEAGRLLLKARKREFSVPPDLSETVIVALCDRNSCDPKTAWELYEAHVLAGYQPSEACTQVLFQTLEEERLLPGEGPDAPQQMRTAGEWGSRFLMLADAAAEAQEFDAVSRYVAFMAILAIREKSLLAGLESLAVRHFDIPTVGEIIKEKAKAYLHEVGDLQVAVKWQSAMAESETWFAARKLAPTGLPGQGFSFVATDPDNPTSYSNEDAVMAIKLAQAWALNPDLDPKAPLTRTFEILSYVFEQLEIDIKRNPVDESRRLSLKVLQAILEMVQTVQRSPSAEVRNREKDLSDYLRLKGLLL